MIRRVDDIIDRPRADGLQSTHEPFGTRADTYTADHDGHVAPRQSVLFHPHVDATGATRLVDARRRRNYRRRILYDSDVRFLEQVAGQVIE